MTVKELIFQDGQKYPYYLKIVENHNNIQYIKVCGYDGVTFLVETLPTNNPIINFHFEGRMHLMWEFTSKEGFLTELQYQTSEL